MPLLRTGLFFFFIFALVHTNAKAQFVDSIKVALKQKPRLDARLDTRNSFISNQRAQMTGVKLGLKFGNTFAAGVGYNYISDYIFDKSKSIINQNPFSADLAQLKLQYVACYAEYQFYNTRRWEFCIPVQLGFGKAFYQYYRSGSVTNRSFVFIYEPSMNGTYKLFDWFGFGANVGYRIMFKNNKRISQHFTSPIYVLTTSFYFGVLYKKALKTLNEIDKSLP